MTELWKDIPGGRGRYQVSNLGRVRATTAAFNKLRWFKETGGILRHYINHDGYPTLSIPLNGKKSPYLIHRLVLLAFVGPQPDGKEGCHNNGLKTDNRPENLRWDTSAGNAADNVTHGRLARGELHPRVKLSEEDVRKIRDSSRSHRLLALDYGVAESLIWAIKKRRTWAWLV